MYNILFTKTQNNFEKEKLIYKLELRISTDDLKRSSKQYDFWFFKFEFLS